jgi:hypothetical protein
VLVDAIGNNKADSGGASPKKDIQKDLAFDGQRVLHPFPGLCAIFPNIDTIGFPEFSSKYQIAQGTKRPGGHHMPLTVVPAKFPRPCF